MVRRARTLGCLGATCLGYLGTLGMTLLCRENRTSAKESGYPR